MNYRINMTIVVFLGLHNGHDVHFKENNHEGLLGDLEDGQHTHIDPGGYWYVGKFYFVRQEHQLPISQVYTNVNFIILALLRNNIIGPKMNETVLNVNFVGLISDIFQTNKFPPPHSPPPPMLKEWD